MPFQDNYSARRVYWPSQETTSDFEPLSTNTAGSHDLATDGVLICGRATKGQTLLFTSSDLWTMTYIGGEFLYSFERAGDNCGNVGPNAVAIADTEALWMGYNTFHVFDGYVRPIPCDVTDYVFGDFSSSNAYKVWAFANPRFGEITWHYPSGSATECDRYVTYNRLEQHWVFGDLARSAGVTKRAGAVVPVPVMIGSNGAIYDHETGTAHGGVLPFLESGPIELGDGDNVVRVQRIVPDDKTQGDVTLSIYGAMSPNGEETLYGPYTVSSPTDVRLTARQVRLRIVESVATSWRVGVLRLGGIIGGRR
ncbi:MAG: hypothetical protein WD802_10315 [Gemmatimonadaceae bacterium]